MKLFFIFLSLSLLLLISANSNSQEAWKTVYSGDAHMNSIYFLNEKTGWVVGNDGFIINTTDEGKNWNYKISGTNSDLYDVFFLNPDTGFISSLGMILKTINSGITWDEIKLDTIINDKKVKFDKIYFKNIDSGYLLGHIHYNKFDESWDHFYFFMSSNMFKNWIVIDTGKYDNFDHVYDSYINYYGNYENYFKDGIGYILYDGGLLKTTDYRKTWRYINSSSFWGIYFINSKLGYGITNRFHDIVKTVSGGE